LNFSKDKEENVNDRVMRTLATIAKCRERSAKRITVVFPSYPRLSDDDQDFDNMTTPSATQPRLLAKMFENAGADHIITIDCPMTSSAYFTKPFNNLYAQDVLLLKLRQILQEMKISTRSNLVVVPCNSAEVCQAEHVAEKLDAQIAIINKNQTQMRLIGNVVSKVRCLNFSKDNKVAIIFGNTYDQDAEVRKSAEFLKCNGAAHVFACFTHAGK
jgi:phosphoribosylpyrophosphate synthetase